MWTFPIPPGPPVVLDEALSFGPFVSAALREGLLDVAGLLAILALAASAAVLLRRLPSLTTEGHREPGRATTPPCSVYAAPVRANAEASGDDDVDAGMRSAA